MFCAIFGYCNTDKSHAFERETTADAKPVTGSESKVNTLKGNQATCIPGDNVQAYRQRVKRVC
ncbi:MAG: hypothetical protein CVV17_00825 [Gammaproteobacteria bacterium HGW-Gammaproteobacteria-7]|nr:MAG: hypothetical protein CVV17_00825 [Gammaproteobacteria bacterium HGW-Gammaproteobacteria-7]